VSRVELSLVCHKNEYLHEKLKFNPHPLLSEPEFTDAHALLTCWRTSEGWLFKNLQNEIFYSGNPANSENFGSDNFQQGAYTMRTQFSKLVLAAGITLAMALTFSCHDGGSDDPGTSSPSGMDNSSSSGGNSGAVGFSSSGGSSSSINNGTVGSSSSGGSSSSVIAFTGDKGTFLDSRDGQTYKWVKISEQIWLAENLRYEEQFITVKRGSKCYDDNENNCDKYGRLYEWYDAMDVCPEGWHLPTRSEWNALLTYVGEKPGKKLKDIVDWRDGNGTNDYGFKALPGGKLTDEYKEVYISGNWWTATEDNEEASFRARMDGGDDVDIRCSDPVGSYRCDAYSVAALKTYKYSVRCVLGYPPPHSIVYGTLVDMRDAQRYNTVKIANQNWMAENLNYKADNSSCYNDKSECKGFGRLYNWSAAKTACPAGWHLPTRSEWNTLLTYVGEKSGKKLKARSSEWVDNYGTDKYGFGALPSGKLTDEYKDIYISGNWWTATEDNEEASFRARMDGGDDVDIRCSDPVGSYRCDAYSVAALKTYKYSVRCVED